MEDDPDTSSEPWVYDVWHREYLQSQEEYEREYKQRLEENRQQRVAGEDARYNLQQTKVAELGYPRRNWAIWRRRKAGATLKQTGDEFGVNAERVRQIVAKLDRKIRKILNHEWNSVPDEIRNGTLGVEFVFRNEVTFDGWNGDRDKWDQLEYDENGSIYYPPNPRMAHRMGGAGHQTV